MKGQGKYVIALPVMIGGITLGLLGLFATEYVIGEAIGNMNENYARYDSMIYSYTVVNEDMNGVLNHSELEEDLVDTEYDYQCVFAPGSSYGVAHEGVRVAFVPNSEDILSSGSSGCAAPYGTIYDDGIRFQSSGLYPSYFYGLYPEMAFYSPADGGSTFVLETRTNPQKFVNKDP